MKLKKRNEKKEEMQIGDRFAIQYGDISTPIYYYSNRHYTAAKVKSNYHNLIMDEILDCWIVLEYLGNNQFIDLITGEIIVYQTNIKSILDTVTIEYEQEALEIQQELLEHPLAIGSYDYDEYSHNGIQSLTTEIKKKIIEESMPRQEEIISIIQKKKKEARKLISLLYAKKNRAKMHRLFNEGTIENKRRDIEAARRRQEEEKRRQEEEQRQAEERLIAEVNPQFNLLFPQEKAKTLIKK